MLNEIKTTTIIGIILLSEGKAFEISFFYINSCYNDTWNDNLWEKNNKKI